MRKFLRKKAKEVFSLSMAIVFLLLLEPSVALDLTPGLLFDQMEKSTERIDSLEAEMILISGPVMSRVSLCIQGPDKFSMNFIDRSISVVFDGEKLWVYLASIKEVFTLDAASGGGWLGEALRRWVNPKKIITNITRSTLFSLFEITMTTPPETPASFTGFLSVASSAPNLRFVPLGSSFVKSAFEVGYYEIVFSPENFLPVRVTEFAPDGSLRGTLFVLGYKINQPIPKENFEFKIPPGVKEVPLIEVVKQRLEQGKDFLLEKVNDLFEALKKKMENWGF